MTAIAKMAVIILFISRKAIFDWIQKELTGKKWQKN